MIHIITDIIAGFLLLYFFIENQNLNRINEKFKKINFEKDKTIVKMLFNKNK